MSYFIYETKNIYYQVTGRGKPLMLLHGDTASSKMFEVLMPLYAEKFRCMTAGFNLCSYSR